MNNSSKSLIFVTYQYPFLPGEYFIEEEIKYVARAFSDIYVFPSRRLWWKPSEAPRKMPTNCTLLDPRDLPLAIRGVHCLHALIGIPSFLREQKAGWPGRKDIRAVGLVQRLKSAFKTLATREALATFLDRKSGEAAPLVGYAYWRDSGAAALAMNRARYSFERLFVRAHRVDIYSHQRWSEETPTHRESTKILPVSDDGRRFLIEEKGLPSESIQVERLGVRMPERATAASVDGILRIVSCSNLVPVKRVSLIAEAIQAYGGRVEWSHIGDGPELEAVRSVVVRFPAEQRFVFKGQMPNQAVYDFYAAHPVDLFINLSESEGVPVSIMEALAHGIPVVATDVGGTAEIVNSDCGQVLSPEATVIEAAAAIREIAEGPDRREAARKRALELCSAEKNYESFCALLTGDRC